MLDDVRQKGEIWYLWIDFSETGRFKNSASRRAIPLHDELIRLGFPEYVQALRDRGETWLFPELKAACTKLGDIWYKRWWPLIKKELPFLAEGQALHSIRHTVNTELKDLRVFPEFRDDLLGHGHKSDNEACYAKIAPLQRLLEVVRQIPVVTNHRHLINLLPEPIAAWHRPSGRKRSSVHVQPTPDPRPKQPRPRLVWDRITAPAKSIMGDGG